MISKYSLVFVISIEKNEKIKKLLFIFSNTL